MLVASLVMLRKGIGQQICSVDLLTLHRAATFLSGADVTGAPSRSNGATKLYLFNFNACELPESASISYFRDRAVRHVSLGIDGEDPGFVHVLQQIAHAENHYLMSHDQDALLA
jgi:hypothetical protein